MANETVSQGYENLKKPRRFMSLISTGRSQRVSMRYSSERAARIRAVRAITSVNSSSQLAARPQGKTGVVQACLKRTIDICGAAAGLILLAPLFAFIAGGIKLSSNGPVFFRQTRLGKDGKPFSIIKFRTMYVDRCDRSGVSQTIKGDPRVTRFGRFLRRTSFDELPQLFNVLKGDMSLVGPRPYVPGMLAAGAPYEHLDYRYYDRLKVSPGITGLAQVKGYRGETSDRRTARRRLEYDFQYIERQSVWLDFKILAGTVYREFVTGTGS